MASLDVNSFCLALWRRKWRVLFAALGAGACAFLIARLLPVRYESEVSLLVDAGAFPVPGGAQRPQVGSEKVHTEADILRSRAVADAVVAELGLAHRPDLRPAARLPRWIGHFAATVQDWVRPIRALAGDHPTPAEDATSAAVETVARRLEVGVEEHSNVLTVRFAAGSPELAAAVVNAAVAQDIALRGQDQRASVQRMREAVDHRLDALQAGIEIAERHLRDYRDRNHFVELSAGPLAVVRLSDQEARLAAARQDFARLEAAVATSATSEQQNDVGAMTEALASPVIQKLEERKAAVTQVLANLRLRLGSRNPTVAGAERELADVRQQIAAESATVMTSLRREVAIAKQRVADAERSVAATRSTAEQSMVTDDMVMQLTRDVASRRQLYDSALALSEQVDLALAELPPLTVISPGVAPTHPAGLPASVTAVMGALAGLLLAVALVLLKSMFHDRVGSAKELAQVSGAQYPVTIPEISGRGRRRVADRVLDMRQSGLAETLRAMRIRLQETAPKGEVKTVLVTSPMPGDGKSSLAVALARICAADGMRVLLIEADLRRPSLAITLGLPSAPGLEAVLARETTLAQSVRIDKRSGLHCLLAQGVALNPQALLESSSFADIMAGVRDAYQIVILDSPPILRVADSILLAGYCDAILMAVSWERTPASLVREMVRRLPSAHRARIVPVLTRVPPRRLEAEGYYTGYGRGARLPVVRR